MHIDRKLEKYLRGDIDFDSFYLVSVEPVTEKYAVIILVPKIHRYFNVRYGELTSKWFTTIEEATQYAVERGFISKAKAKAINLRYYSVYGG